MHDPSRDKLWEAAYKSYYDAFFNELVAEKIVSMWQRLDSWTKVVVALTASGSAVTGWILWEQPGPKVIWAIIAGVGAVSSIVHTALRVPGRLTVWSDLRSSFAGVRLDFETLRYKMEVHPDFSVADVEEEFVSLRTRLAEAIQVLQPDVFMRTSLQIKCQRELNLKLGQRGNENPGHQGE